jgi:hypothetical protein
MKKVGRLIILRRPVISGELTIWSKSVIGFSNRKLVVCKISSTVRLDVLSVDHAQFAILELKRETGISGLDYQSRPNPSWVAFLALTDANKNEILSVPLDARGLLSSESRRDLHLEHLSLRQPALESLLQK